MFVQTMLVELLVKNFHYLVSFGKQLCMLKTFLERVHWQHVINHHMEYTEIYPKLITWSIV